MNTNTSENSGLDGEHPDYDIAVVGGGILGLSVARELLSRRPELRVVLIEKENRVAAHQTGHNSGVIHSGIYYVPGSLKARLCVEGSRLMMQYCEDHAVPYARSGKLIVAKSAREVRALEELYARGRANQVPGLRWLEGDEISEIEPLCVGKAALHSPNTGVVDYAEVCRSLERGLREQGVSVLLSEEVERVERVGGATAVRLRSGRTIRAGWAVTCAGLWSDRLAERSAADPNPRIVPFRGAYLHLAPSAQPDVVRGMVYPVPDPALPFLGVHITRHIDGSVSIGPTAFLATARDGYRMSRISLPDLWSVLTWPGFWRVVGRFWKTGFTELGFILSRASFVRAAAEFIPDIKKRKLLSGRTAGVRAQAVDRDGSLVDDFVISDMDGVTHVRNAPSPAATSALALAKHIADRLDSHLVP